MSEMQGARPDLPQVVPQAPWIRRVPLRSPTLPPATHTNAYAVGDGDVLLVDPGTPWTDAAAPLYDTIRSLLDAGHRVRAVVLTHHHFDHVSGAAELARTFSLPLWAHVETAQRIASRLDVPVTRYLVQDEILPFGPRGLRVLHTPGHAPGHVCLFDEAGGGLLAGDMVASQGTIIVAPSDDGDMTLYLASLRLLLGLGPVRIWPAHGVAVEEGEKLLARYLEHRLLREEKVVRALMLGAKTMEALLPLAYDDTPAAFYPLAKESLLAHLLALISVGRVARTPQAEQEDLFVLLRP